MAKAIKKHLNPTWSITLTEHPEPGFWSSEYIWYVARVNEEKYSEGLVHFMDISYTEPSWHRCGKWGNKLNVSINDCDFQCDIFEIDFRYYLEFFIRITPDNHKAIDKAMLWLAKHHLNQQRCQAHIIESMQWSFNRLRKCNNIALESGVSEPTQQTPYK